MIGTESRWRRGVATLFATGALVAAGLVGATSASAADTATLTINTANPVLGGKLNISGDNWVNKDGSKGSVIGVKFDLGGISRLPDQLVNPNATVWEVIEIGADGKLNHDVQLPSGATSGANGSTPAFTAGAHKLTLLTGTLGDNDEIRSKTLDFTVAASGPTDPGPTDPGPTDPGTPAKPTSATVSGAVNGASLGITSSGFTEGQNLYTVQIDDGAQFKVPANGNANGSLSVSEVSLSQYGIASGSHKLSVLWAADQSTLASADFTYTADPTDPGPGPTDPGQPGDGINKGIVVTAEVAPLEPGDGALALSVASDRVSLTEGAAAGDRRTFTGALPTVTVSDSRTAAQAGTGGWTTSGQAGDFTYSDHTIPGKNLGWTPKVLTQKAGVTPGSAVTSGFGGGDGLSKSSSLATATSEGRSGSTDLGADLDFQIPVDSAAGSYSGTLTVSLFATD